MTDKLIQIYHAIEEKMPIFPVQQEYTNLVRANKNGNVPIQRWYHCKEAFSVDLLEKLLLDWRIPANGIQRILDPFLGIGTTLLAAQKLHKNNPLVEAIGIEINPFLHFVSSTKINWYLYNQFQLQQLSKKILNANELPSLSIPELTTLRREEVFKRETIQQILGYKSLIYSLQDKVESQALLLGLASILEQVSGVRKDGRALRIVRGKRAPPVEEALFEAWNKICEDLQIAPTMYSPLPCKVLRGDGRRLEGERFSPKSLGKFDLILCSPPYLNNIDYTEVYKIELWMLDFISSYDEFRELRYRTFRSHPSVRFKEGLHLYENYSYNSDFALYLNTLKDSLPRDRDFKWRSRLFEEYFDDVYLSLKHQWNVLNHDGWAFWVIGNSLHGSAKFPERMIPVVSDLLTAQLALDVGFTVKGIMIARNLRRRSHKAETNYFLRESIIVLQKSK
jgi:DNA modification methylase